MEEFPKEVHLVKDEDGSIKLDLDYDPMWSDKEAEEYVTRKQLRDCQSLVGELKKYITDTCLKDEKLRESAIRILRLSSSEAAKRTRF